MRVSGVAEEQMFWFISRRYSRLRRALPRDDQPRKESSAGRISTEDESRARLLLRNSLGLLRRLPHRRHHTLRQLTQTQGETPRGQPHHHRAYLGSLMHNTITQHGWVVDLTLNWTAHRFLSESPEILMICVVQGLSIGVWTARGVHKWRHAPWGWGQTFCDDGWQGGGVLRMRRQIKGFILMLPHRIILREHEWNILNILSL